MGKSWRVRQWSIKSAGASSARPSSQAKDLVWLILLVSWLPLKKRSKPWQIIEFFSGRGRLSRLAAKAGFEVASFDINKRVPKNKRRSSRREHHFDKRQPFDINGEIGFTCLICATILLACLFHISQPNCLTLHTGLGVTVLGNSHHQTSAQALRGLVFAGRHGLGDGPSYSLFNMGGSKFGNVTSLLLGSPGFSCVYGQPSWKQNGLQDGVAVQKIFLSCGELGKIWYIFNRSF